MGRRKQFRKVRLCERTRKCPKCSANPITVTPIWKWEFENKEHPIRGLYRTFFEKILFKFPFSYKRFHMGQKIIFLFDMVKFCDFKTSQ